LFLTSDNRPQGFGPYVLAVSDIAVSPGLAAVNVVDATTKGTAGTASLLGRNA
jgi:hypothetical protein